MPVIVQRISETPVLLATFEGDVTIDDVRQSFADSDAVIADGETLVYRISDYRRVKTDFMTAMQAIREIKDNPPGSPSDPRIHSVFLGTNHWTKMARDVLRQGRFGIEVAIFTELEDALKYIALDKAKRTA